MWPRAASRQRWPGRDLDAFASFVSPEAVFFGDTTVLRGRVRVIEAFDPAGKKIGNFSSIWRREPDGRWLIIFDKGCPRMFVRIWKFRVHPGKTQEFEAAYGPTGPWAQLFERVAGYCGTELLTDPADLNTYFTLDWWESAEAWAAFLRAWSEDYAALDRRCESLATSELEIGEFQGSDAVNRCRAGT